MMHFLQSHEWEKYEQMEGHKTFWRDGEGYHVLAVLKNTPMGKYLFCPYGPAVESKKDLGRAFDSLLNLARDQEVMFVRVEPTVVLDEAEMKKYKMRPSHELDPAHTWVIDLSGGEEALLQKIDKRRVRYWRTLGNKGVTIRTSKDPEDVKILSEMLERLGEARKFNPQDENHLKNQIRAGFGTLYIVEFEGKAIAAALVHDYGDTRFYMHAAADDEYARFRPAIGVTIQAMLDAQRDGKTKFDFWGITTSEDPNHPWYGFTQYKKSYEGEQVDYTGTCDIVMRPLRYKVYQGLRKVNRLLRKK